MVTTERMTSGSGFLYDNITCEAFYQFVIGAIQSLSGASRDDDRSVYSVWTDHLQTEISIIRYSIFVIFYRQIQWRCQAWG